MEQTALITGASKRIGRAVASHLCSKGWNVAIHYNTSAHDALLLVDEFSRSYSKQKFIAVKADLSIGKEAENLITEVISKLGKIDLVINNASVFEKGFIKDTSIEKWNEHIDTNLKAPFVLMRDFALYCKSGNIINFVDTRITQNKSDFASYSISKKGLWELTKMAALEFAPEIRVNAIAPGVTLAPVDKDSEYLHALADKIPMKKPGGLEPILQSIDYILENKHLTGQLLFADGGENLG